MINLPKTFHSSYSTRIKYKVSNQSVITIMFFEIFYCNSSYKYNTVHIVDESLMQLVKIYNFEEEIIIKY